MQDVGVEMQRWCMCLGGNGKGGVGLGKIGQNLKRGGGHEMKQRERKEQTKPKQNEALEAPTARFKYTKVTKPKRKPSETKLK